MDIEAHRLHLAGSRWRCLDGLGCALAAAVFLLALPCRRAGWHAGFVDPLAAWPLVFGAAAVFGFGVPPELAGSWRIWRWRASWLVLAGTAPFAAWWSRCPEPVYLGVGAALALAAAPWAMLEAAAAIGTMAQHRCQPGLAREALIARIVLLYLLLIPAAAMLVTFGLALLTGSAHVPDDWLRFWRVVPGWGQAVVTYGPMLAVLNLARLLLRASPVLMGAGPIPTADWKEEGRNANQGPPAN